MKRLLAFLMCLILVMLLAACDNGEAPVDGSSSDTSSKLSAAQDPSVDNSQSSQTTSATDSTSSEKTYVDANTDFSGKVTIVGRWHCITNYETATGKSTDVSKEGQYYIFESTGRAETFYMDTLMIEYSKYSFTVSSDNGRVKEGTLVLSHGPTSVSLGCIVEEKRMTIYTRNSGNQNYQTVYERVDFPKN